MKHLRLVLGSEYSEKYRFSRYRWLIRAVDSKNFHSGKVDVSIWIN